MTLGGFEALESSQRSRSPDLLRWRAEDAVGSLVDSDEYEKGTLVRGTHSWHGQTLDLEVAEIAQPILKWSIVVDPVAC